MTQKAKNYAQALYELHVDAESVKTAETILKEVPEVGESLTNPTIAFHVKEKIIDRIFPEGIRNFIKVVCRNQKSGLLLEMFEAYREIERKANEGLEAVLFYVTAPTVEQQEKMKTFLRRKFHVKEVALSLKEEKSLIGGFILQAGGREFDWSFRGRFRALSRALQH